MERLAIGLLLAATLLLATACGRDGDGDMAGTRPATAIAAPRHADGSGSAEVTYLPNVHVVEQADGYDALTSVSTDGSTLVFDRSLGRIPRMAAGDALVIKGLVARKIIAVEEHGNELAVLTVRAGFPDLFSDARIKLHAPIRFGASQALAGAPASPPPASPLQLAMDALVPSARAQDPASARGDEAVRKGRRDAYGNLAKAPIKEMISGWETSFVIDPQPGRLNMTLEMKKSNAGVTAIVTGEGYLADFDLDAGLDMERSTVEQLQLAYRKLNGKMTFHWVIQTTEGGSLRGNARMKLPAAIEIPLYQYLGGVPLFLEISSAALIKPALGAQYEFSRGSFEVRYSGTQSFSLKKGVPEADGDVSGGLELQESEGGSGAPIGLVVAFAAPRIELSIGVSKILKFDGIKDAARVADKYLDVMVAKLLGPEALAKLKESPLNEITPSKAVEAAMGSNAAAYVELVTTSGMSHTGNAVMVPCTRTDLNMAVKIGVNAQAFGQDVGDASREVFSTDVTRVRPSGNALCNNI